jgi:hypothetical protein
MNEKNWDDSLEGEEAKEFFDSTAIMVDEEPEQPASTVNVRDLTSGSNITALRRRIEERMDSKRIAHEFDYDDLDELLDSMD